MKICRIFGPLVITTLLITACGGGGSSDGSGGGGGGAGLVGANVAGETAPTVAIDESNALSLAVAATEGAGQAVRSDDFPGVSPIGATEESIDIRYAVRAVRQQQVIQCSSLDGGSGTAVLDFSDNGQSFSIVYNCSTITGSYTGEYFPDAANWTTFTATYNNLQVDGNTINGTISCTRPSVESFEINCSYSINGIEGLTGSTYSITNSTVSGDETTGYNVTATVTDPTVGAVDYSATNIIYGECPYGVPSSGAISITGINSTQATVTFIDCNTFSVAVGSGAVVTYNWADIATVSPIP